MCIEDPHSTNAFRPTRNFPLEAVEVWGIFKSPCQASRCLKCKSPRWGGSFVRPPATCYLLPTTCYLLHVAYVTRYLLPTTFCRLPFNFSLLLVTYCTGRMGPAMHGRVCCPFFIEFYAPSSYARHLSACGSTAVCCCSGMQHLHISGSL